MGRTLPILALAFCLSAHAARAGESPAGLIATRTDESSAGPIAARTAIVEADAPPRVPTALDSVPHPWPGIALALSAAGTAAPIVALGLMPHNDSNRNLALAIVGTEIVTPSFGHLYAGLSRRAVTGMVVRGVGFGIVIAAGASNGWWSGDGSTDFSNASIAALLGATIMGVSALVDVVTVPGDVERRNAAWPQQHASVGLRLGPRASPELALSLRF